MGKAKTGLGTVRQFWSDIDFPPNAFTVGDVTYSSPVKEGRGYDTIRTGVVNGPASPGTLRVEGAWLATGPFVVLHSEGTAVDPLSGLDAAEFIIQFSFPFLRATFIPAGAPNITANFQLGAYMLPIDSAESGAGAGGVGGNGAIIDARADVAVGIGAVVPLAVPPAGTIRMTVQETGGNPNIRVRIRQLGGPAGAGVVLGPLGSVSFGGREGSIAAVEAQGDPALATTVAVLFERG